MSSIEQIMQSLSQLHDKVDALSEKFAVMVHQGDTKEKKNALRRQYYREAKAERDSGKLKLPTVHVFGCGRPDRRVCIERFVQEGLRFGRINEPFGFLKWFVYMWNSETYLKKCVTYSGSAFCVWNGTCRYKIGLGDLMHYYRRRVKLVPFLRSNDEEADFRSRPWWDWGTNVLRPVVFAMREHEEWGTFDEHFKTWVSLLCGGVAEVKIDDCYWDFFAGRNEINKMMKKIGPQFLQVLEACIAGLRATVAPPVPPSHPLATAASTES